jgi:hypothetical protein
VHVSEYINITHTYKIEHILEEISFDIDIFLVCIKMLVILVTKIKRWEEI